MRLARSVHCQAQATCIVVVYAGRQARLRCGIRPVAGSRGGRARLQDRNTSNEKIRMKFNRLTTMVLVAMVLGVLVGYACNSYAPDRKSTRLNSSHSQIS